MDRVVQYDLPKVENNYTIRFLLPQHPCETTVLKTGDLLVQCSVPFT